MHKSYKFYIKNLLANIATGQAMNMHGQQVSRVITTCPVPFPMSSNHIHHCNVPCCVITSCLPIRELTSMTACMKIAESFV